MKDLFFFMFLLSIWVVAYGVAKQGILIHNDTRLDWIFRGAIYEPYLIIFGNFPENLAGKLRFVNPWLSFNVKQIFFSCFNLIVWSSTEAKFSLDSCSMNGTDPLKPKCPILNENHAPVFPEWLTITMLCVYLLFANILLLNLLIAIFKWVLFSKTVSVSAFSFFLSPNSFDLHSFTFQEVQDNTDRIWKFQRYELIKEYHSRPAAPPPFIIFSHLSLLIRSIWLCKSHCKCKDLSKFCLWCNVCKLWASFYCFKLPFMTVVCRLHQIVLTLCVITERVYLCIFPTIQAFKSLSQFFRGSDWGHGATVLGGFNEGQIPAVCEAGDE